MSRADDHLADLPTEGWQRLEACIERFEQAWKGKQRPRLEDFLPADAPDRRSVLIELALVDLECRLRGGEPARVEEYLKRYPELAQQLGTVVGLLAREAQVRSQVEPGFDAAELYRRFPKHRQALAARLERDKTVGSAPTPALPPAGPPQKLTVPDMLQALSAGPFLTPSQLAELQKMVSENPKLGVPALAEQMASQGWLTAFQIQFLLKGRLANTILGPYLLLDKLGEGGMGQVFKARHQVMKRLVAVKVIRKGKLAYAEQIERFQREIEVMAQLSHPNIVLAHDAGRVGETHYFAMEYVEGVDLARRLAKGPLPIDQACDCIRQAALGMQHAHERGLIHRDLKPSNLLVCKSADADQEMVKVLDLGLARLLHDPENRGRITKVGDIMGTPDYIAPEQASDASNVDIRADIYSLGCTLYHLIAGQPPFPGGTLSDKLIRHRRDMPVPLKQLRPLPSGLNAVVERMLAKQPEERFQTPKEVAVALVPYCEALRWQAMANTPAVPGDAAPVGLAPRKSRRWRLGMGLASALLIGLAALVLSSRTNQHVQPTEASPRPVRHAGFDYRFLEAMKIDEVLPSHRLVQVKNLVYVLHDTSPKAPLSGTYAVAFSPDGHRLLTRAYKESAVWDLEGRRLAFTIPIAYQERGSDIALSPEGRYTLVQTGQGLNLWDLLKRQPGQRMQDSLVASSWTSTFSPDGKRVAAADDVGLVRLWDRDSGKFLRAFGEPSSMPIRSARFSSDGKYLLTAPGAHKGDEKGLVRVWEAATGKELARYDVVPGNGCYSAFSPDGERLAYGSPDGTIWIWQWKAAGTRPPVMLKSPKGTYGKYNAVLSVQFTPDGRRLVSSSQDGLVLLWDLDTRQATQLAQMAGPVWLPALTPDGRFLAFTHTQEMGKVYILRMP